MRLRKRVMPRALLREAINRPEMLSGSGVRVGNAGGRQDFDGNGMGNPTLPEGVDGHAPLHQLAQLRALRLRQLLIDHAHCGGGFLSGGVAVFDFVDGHDHVLLAVEGRAGLRLQIVATAGVEVAVVELGGGVVVGGHGRNLSFCPSRSSRR